MEIWTAHFATPWRHG